LSLLEGDSKDVLKESILTLGISYVDPEAVLSLDRDVVVYLSCSDPSDFSQGSYQIKVQPSRDEEIFDNEISYSKLSN